MKVNLPKRQFFDWKEYEKVGLICAGGITIINGGRNIGKTTGTFVRWLEKASPDNMIMYIRNTDKELKAYAKSFNAQFSGKWYMSGNSIFSLQKIDLYKKDKETGEQVYDKSEYRRDQVIGYVASLNGTDGWRSANFDKVKYIFSDEYNQIGNSLKFDKFMTLWTSILRTKKDVYTVIIGNRDDAAAEMIVELGIEIIIPENYHGDWIVQLLPDSKEFKDKCWFIDLDDNRFTNNEIATVWKELGKQSEKMGKYYDRGYKSYENIDCRRLKKSTMEKVKWDWEYKQALGNKLVIGTIKDIVIVHIDLFDEYKARLKFSDTYSTFADNGYDNIAKNYQYCFFSIVNASKSDKIIFTSIDAKEQITKLMGEFALIIDKETIII